MAEGLRLWVLPDPDIGGINANDMQLLGVGIAFYEATIIPPIPPAPEWGGGGGMVYPVHSEWYDRQKEKERKARIDDNDFMQLLSMITPIILD